MHDPRLRDQAAELRRAGHSWSEISRRLGVSRSALREWSARGGARARLPECPRCEDVDLDGEAYAALLGFYLGDGCLSAAARYWALRVACDARQPGIIADVTRCVLAIRPGSRVFPLQRPGCVVVTSQWRHWYCLFPQHGPGRKHERPIVLEDWQRAVVELHPAAFLRGLFHSDGSRVRNWTRQQVAGGLKRYDYPRWQFTNVSADIRELCCWGLDLVEVPWRQSRWNCISVSRREAVARLDELIGPKT
ncbi:helix-turn-helix domain-containing protein [Nocardioides dongxiaopingii]|uniref:helix-turn-helix domain-containing protein n=1 Tax=Nocardioides dongxiaopingii TaxID=2576036 RepID=UPI0010C76E29|nr:helix-turn-helix domain-containing protein [Nocardioides dongxiaopingii]